MSFAPGNQLAIHRRTVENALRRAAHRSPAKLDKACDALISSAADGDSWQERIAAFGLLADRLDGRARQSLDITGDGQARELSLSDVVHAVLAARSASATDLVPRETSDALAQTVPSVDPDAA